MNWKTKMVCRILLCVAEIISLNSGIADDRVKEISYIRNGIMLDKEASA